MPDNLRAFFPDPDGKDSSDSLKQYIKWCLTEGQAFNESLGYVRLAPQVIARTMAAVDNIR